MIIYWLQIVIHNHCSRIRLFPLVWTVLLKSSKDSALLLCGTWWEAPLMMAKTTPLYVWIHPACWSLAKKGVLQLFIKLLNGWLLQIKVVKIFQGICVRNNIIPISIIENNVIFAELTKKVSILFDRALDIYIILSCYIISLN